MMKDKTCCFTGHRKIPPEQYECIVKRLKSEIIDLINQGVIYYGAGGALGFDTMAAQIVIELRKEYPQIKLILVLPCRTQTRGWNGEDISVYEKILKECDKCVYMSEEYSRDCMFKRNRHLVDNSGVCICYLTECSGGTEYTVKYAEKNNLKIINIADERI